MKKIVALLIALIALPGCSTLKPYTDNVVASGKAVVDSFDVEVTEESASVSAIGVSASVNWKVIGCAIVGFVVPDLCEEEDAETQ